jgi:hypothetical protein
LTNSRSCGVLIIGRGSAGLRAAIEALLLLTEFLYSRVTDIEEHNLLDSTVKNVKRLQRLSNDMGDIFEPNFRVAKIIKIAFPFHIHHYITLSKKY